MNKSVFFASVLALAAACTPSQKTVQTPLPTPATEPEVVVADEPMLETELDSAAEAAFLNELLAAEAYRPAEAMPWDLQHTRLRLRFDWAKEQVIGQATLRLRPTFRPQATVTIDAKGFEFKQVALGERDKRPLRYAANDSTVVITLDRTYARGEDIELYLDYVATPAESGGSEAITSDKGLFFINPRGEEADKPRQIWTQGETEHNSRWMPTIDQPNERATQEFWLTVDDKYTTLSNGLLVSSNKNADGTRTDYWRMDIPHAPYLHMLAVGEFAKVDDRWRDVPLSYYVEPEYEQDAKEIFAHTPEMLTFFSELLGVDYPWPKYSQIVVRDYVSGAMENTTAVVFGEFIQKHADELAEDNNDLIVAHEMFHHWFGDYVTTEAWSNLTLNEGFANYSEYLWLERHEGRGAAEAHRLNELQGYLSSGSRGGFHPLIWYQYRAANGEDMFDQHSYNKGGLVLHMLRGYLGDEAFFASLKRYLEVHKLTAVEVDELRMAFEDTVGEDLHWFFDQWFLGNGHPELTVTYGYADGQAMVTVEQTQDPSEFRPVFRLPTRIGHYPAAGGAPVMHDVVVTQRRQTFSFPAAEGDLLVFDPESRVLGTRDEERPAADEVRVFERVGEPVRRLLAIREVRKAVEDSSFVAPAGFVARALGDAEFRIQNNAIALVDLDDAAAVAQLRALARNGKNPSVRESALVRLAEREDDPGLVGLYREVLAAEKSDRVRGAALRALYERDPAAALAEARKLESTDSDAMAVAIATLYATTGDSAYLPFFERKLPAVDNQAAGEFAAAYIGLAIRNGAGATERAVERLATAALDQSTSLWRRYSFTTALAELRSVSQSQPLKEMLGGADLAPMLTARIEAIKAAETSRELQEAFSQM